MLSRPKLLKMAARGAALTLCVVVLTGCGGNSGISFGSLAKSVKQSVATAVCHQSRYRQLNYARCLGRVQALAGKLGKSANVGQMERQLRQQVRGLKSQIGHSLPNP